MDNLKTLGEQRVRVNFNVTNDTNVDNFKITTASLINDLEAMRNDEVSKTYEHQEHTMRSISGERLRLIEKAQELYETAAMYAVKAATYEL